MSSLAAVLMSATAEPRRPQCRGGHSEEKVRIDHITVMMISTLTCARATILRTTPPSGTYSAFYQHMVEGCRQARRSIIVVCEYKKTNLFRLALTSPTLSVSLLPVNTMRTADPLAFAHASSAAPSQAREPTMEALAGGSVRVRPLGRRLEMGALLAARSTFRASRDRPTSSPRHYACPRVPARGHT